MRTARRAVPAGPVATQRPTPGPGATTTRRAAEVADAPSPAREVPGGLDPPDGGAVDRPGTLEQRLRAAASVVAPTTVITALLYYFGYVSTRARFGWFGLDLATLRLSTQEVLLHSAAIMFVPVGALLLCGVGGSWLHGAAQRRLGEPSGRPLLRRTAVVTSLAGVLLLVRGLVGVAVPRIAETEFPGTTPLCLGAGVLAVAYGRHLWLGTATAGRTQDRGRRRREDTGWVLVWGLVVLSLFWLTNSFAGAYGRGQAVSDAADLQSRPAVVLDTAERLYLEQPGVVERALPAAADQQLRYRYRGLRLLVAAGGRLFLVPDRWQDGSGVLVLPDDDQVRVRYIP